MKIKSLYDNIPDMINNIKGAEITMTEYINDHYVFHVKCEHFLVDCIIMALFNNFTKNMKHLRRCLEKECEEQDESTIDSIHEL